MKKITVTGSTSMLGLALIEHCIENGTRVVALARKDSPRLSRLPQSSLVTVVPCELNELSDATLFHAEDSDAFYHFAWEGTDRARRDDAHTQNRNIGYTLAAVDLAARLRCGRFIGAGSQAEYGSREKGQTGTLVSPQNAYGVAKYAAGKLVAYRCQALGLSGIWARVFSVYGPGDMAITMVMQSIARLLAREHLPFTKCEQEWDYLYSSDAGHAFYLMGEMGCPGAVYDLGSGKTRPLLEYVQAIRDAIDPDLPLGVGELDYTPGQTMYLCADISALFADTGFVSQTPFEEGIRKTIDCYRRELL